MGTNSQGILKPISGLLALSLAISGCSKLEFETSDKLISQSDLISESFTAKGDYSDKSVDVLVVVDNSYSMEVEQEKLGQRLDRFISSLRGVDWQIGVTTTDVSMGNYGIQGSLLPLEGANGYILTPRTADYEQVFLDTITREETLNCAAEMDCPSSDEQALSAIMMAIDKRDTDNAGFFRPNADLAVIILTDEDEKSNGPDDATQPFEVQEHLATHLPGKTAPVFGIISQVGDTTCADANGLDVGVFSRHAQELSELQDECAGDMNMMRHCRQCRADAVGLLGEDRGAEFTIDKIEEMKVDYASAMERRAEVLAQIEAHRLRKDQEAEVRAITTNSLRDLPSDTRPVLMAVATRGQGIVNQHFGHAKEFLVYEASPAGVRFISHRRAEQYCNGDDSCGDGESVLATTIRSLEGCEAVICSKIGYAPWGRLEKAGIIPNGEYAMEPIEYAVAGVYREMFESGRLTSLASIELRA